MNGLGSAAKTGEFQQSEQVLSPLPWASQSEHLKRLKQTKSMK